MPALGPCPMDGCGCPCEWDSAGSGCWVICTNCNYQSIADDVEEAQYVANVHNLASRAVGLMPEFVRFVRSFLEIGGVALPPGEHAKAHELIVRAEEVL